MATNSPPSDPPVGMGLTSVILGSVGTLLFFLPVLGVPLGIVGLTFGVTGFVIALLGGRTSLRWSVVGIIVSGLAVGIGAAIALAPAPYLPSPPTTSVEESAPIRAYVAPPARPGA